tara:strand:- start:55 stop:798 length:744 start_codon:yes stop_codon:yes gene_type:complete
MEPKFNLPTEKVELPSKGLLYPKDSPLSSGVVEMKYMTAKEEDILTNQNYLRDGTAVDRLLKSLIIDKNINFNDLLLGDKNAIMVAARVLSYGKDYQIVYEGEEYTVDLSTLESNYLDKDLIKDGKNEFAFTLPSTDNTVTFKLLTHGDEKAIEREVLGLQKLDKKSDPGSSTRLKHMITSVNGLTEKKDIRNFVDNYLLAKDARELRKKYIEVSPDINMVTTVDTVDGGQEDIEVPVTLKFFWPDL